MLLPRVFRTCQISVTSWGPSVHDMNRWRTFLSGSNHKNRFSHILPHTSILFLKLLCGNSHTTVTYPLTLTPLQKMGTLIRHAIIWNPARQSRIISNKVHNYCYKNSFVNIREHLMSLRLEFRYLWRPIIPSTMAFSRDTPPINDWQELSKWPRPLSLK